MVGRLLGLDNSGKRQRQAAVGRHEATPPAGGVGPAFSAPTPDACAGWFGALPPEPDGVLLLPPHAARASASAANSAAPPISFLMVDTSVELCLWDSTSRTERGTAFVQLPVNP